MTDRQRYTQKQYDTATKEFFYILDKEYPKSKGETVTCVDTEGTFPIGHWRPEPTSQVSLDIELQDDGGEPYAVVSARHRIRIPSSHSRGICHTVALERIYPDEFHNLPTIIEFLKETKDPIINIQPNWQGGLEKLASDLALEEQPIMQKNLNEIHSRYQQIFDEYGITPTPKEAAELVARYKRDFPIAWQFLQEQKSKLN